MVARSSVVKDSPAEWQERLDREGRVEFRHARTTLVPYLIFDAAALAWFLWLTATGGATVLHLLPLVLISAVTVLTGWRWFRPPPPWLVVARYGVEVPPDMTIAFTNIDVIEVSRGRLTIVAKPILGAEPTRALVLVPEERPALVHELATWLLRLRSGPRAEVVMEKTSPTTGIYRLRKQA